MTAGIRKYLKLQLRYQGRGFRLSYKRCHRASAHSVKQLERRDKAIQVQHKQDEKYHGTHVHILQGIQHTGNEELCPEENKTQETGKFSQVLNH